jgi:hypothetical protein
MSTCPIRNKEWNTLVQRVGKVEAYRVYNRNDHNVPGFTFEKVEDVEDYLKDISELHKRDGKYYIKTGGDLRSYNHNREIIETKIAKVNQIYNGLLIIDSHDIPQTEARVTSKYNIGRTKAHFVDIIPQALEDHYAVFKDRAKEANDDITELSSMYQENIDKKEFDLKKNENIKQILQHIYPEVKLEYTDNSIDHNYVIKLKNIIKNKEYKSEEDRRDILSEISELQDLVIGRYHSGEILINSLLQNTDTLPHEYAHHYIGMFINSPLVQNGIKIFGSEEKLVQAIGENSIKALKWYNRFWNWIKGKFNTKQKELNNLTYDFLNRIQLGKEEKINTIGEKYQTKSKEKTAEENIRGKYNLNIEEEEKTDVQKLYEKARTELSFKVKVYGRIGDQSKEKSLKNIYNQIQNLENDPVRALKIFQDYAITQLNTLYKRYLDIKQKEGIGKSFTIEELEKWKDHVMGFSSIKDLISFAKGIALVESNDPKIQKAKELFLEPKNLERLTEASTTYDKIIEAYKTEGKKLLSKFLRDHSSHIKAEYRDIYERAYKKLSPEEQGKISKDDYINRELDLNSERINISAEKLINKELEHASSDINQIRRWAGNMLDSQDVIVSSMAHAIYEADRKSRMQRFALQQELIDILREFENSPHVKGTEFFGDIEKAYEFMLEKDLLGNKTGHIVDIFTSDFWDGYNEIQKEAKDKGLTFDETDKLVHKWWEENSDVNWEDYNKDKDVFLTGLYKAGIIDSNEKGTLSYRKGDFGERVNDEAERMYVEWNRAAYRKHSFPKDEKFISKQWLELAKIANRGKSVAHLEFSVQRDIMEQNKSGDPRVKMYNFIRKNLDKHNPKVPYYNRLYTRLPSVIKDVNERIKSDSNNLKSSLYHVFGDNLNVLADDDTRGEVLRDEAGNVKKFIPVYYTNNLGVKYQKEYETLPDERIKQIEEQYAPEFNQLSLIDRVKFDIKKYAKKRYIQDNANKDQSYDIAGIYFKFFSSTIDYAERSEILPQMEMAKFFVENRDVEVRDRKGIIKTDKITGKDLYEKRGNTALAEQLKDIYDALIFGIKEKEEGSLFFGKVDTAKFVNLMNRYTSINLLGLNFVQGFANASLGKMMQTIEAISGRHFNTKELAVANLYYYKNFMSTLGDIESRSPKGVISLLLHEFDILNEYTDGKFRKNSKLRGMMETSTLMFFTKAGEHEMQTKALLAMLERKEALDSEGNSLGSMLDCLKVKDGRLTFEGKNGKKVANFDSKVRLQFEGEVKRVLSQMHGEYSELGRTAMQTYSIGRMGIMFRKFIVPGWDRRYSKEYVNNISGLTEEGMYITTGRFISNLCKDLKILRWSLVSGEWNNLLDREKANVIKTIAEVSIMLSSLLLANILLGMRDNDDDDNWTLSFLAYQAARFRSEMWFFTDPSQTMKLLRSPAAVMSMLENTIKFTGQLTYPMFSGEWEFAKYERGPWKGHYKIEKIMLDYIPVAKQVYRTKDVDEFISFLK